MKIINRFTNRIEINSQIKQAVRLWKYKKQAKLLKAAIVKYQFDYVKYRFAKDLGWNDCRVTIFSDNLEVYA